MQRMCTSTDRGSRRIMNRVIRTVSTGLLLAAAQPMAAADPSAGQTTVLGPFTGVGAPLHPANKSPLSIKYYGTDLGWSYEHRGQLHFLFGDSAATEKGELIEASSKSVYDDGFGTIDLKEWSDPALITPQNIPLIRLGQNPGTTEMSAINPGHAMESFKTPARRVQQRARRVRPLLCIQAAGVPRE